MNKNEKKNVLVKSGRIIDPEKGKEFISDIYIKDGILAEMGENIKAKGKELTEIDAKGCIVCPGFVDMHVHLRDPGFEDEETIETGTLAAVKGGITTVVCMPNTNPPIDSESMVKYILEKSEDAACRILPVAAMTRGLKG
ncbi:MAG: amidohydrolase family protein, partial [Actinobacteria bacterium]|nr:amidohydrolase family protein [Actinomycetota bacterium]